MVSEKRPRSVSRRSYLTVAGVTGIGGLAGCLGGNGDDTSDGDGDTGNGDGDTGGGDGGDEFEEFDPANFEETLPQLGGTLVDHDFHLASADELEAMEPRDEPRYGEPVPEPPEDESELIDPDTLVFTVAPTDDPAAYEDTYEPMIENLEAETGRDVDYFTVDSYAAQVEAMRAERLHIGRFATGNTPFAVNLADSVPFAIPLDDGLFGNRIWVVTRADNDEINELGDLAGHEIPHTSEGSNSGHQAPSALFQEHGVTPGEDYEITFSGDHEVSILGVGNEDYEAAPVASTVFERLVRRDDIDPDEYKIVHSSQIFPLGAFAYRYNLVPEVREGIVAAITEYDYSGTTIKEDLGYDEFVEIDYPTHWDIVLTIHEDLGMGYVEDEL